MAAALNNQRRSHTCTGLRVGGPATRAGHRAGGGGRAAGKSAAGALHRPAALRCRCRRTSVLALAGGQIVASEAAGCRGWTVTDGRDWRRALDG